MGNIMVAHGMLYIISGSVLFALSASRNAGSYSSLRASPFAMAEETICMTRA